MGIGHGVLIAQAGLLGRTQVDVVEWFEVAERTVRHLVRDFLERGLDALSLRPSPLHRHGVDAQGRQRFLCVRKKSGCGRTFNGLTATPFARMRKPELWARFIHAMAAGHLSIDNLHRFGVALWRWRTVILRVLSDAPQRQLARSLATQRD